MLQIVLIGLLAMCLIITFELWQSNKRLKKMIELDKAKKWRDCLMKISRLKIKRFNMIWSAIDE